MGDESPNGNPGDIILVIQEQEHNLFKRNGSCDLVISKDISIYQALTGVRFTLTHLDGREIRIETGKNKTIPPGSLFTVGEEGMPRRGRGENGNMIIQFNVCLPNQLNEKQLDLLRKMFPEEEALSTFSDTDLYYLAMPLSSNYRSVDDKDSEDGDRDENPPQCRQS